MPKPTIGHHDAASDAVLTDLTLGLDLAGVAANALLGAVKARECRLDLFGVTVVAIASGLAGGIIRDVLLQRGPPLALVHPVYLVTALGGDGRRDHPRVRTGVAGRGVPGDRHRGGGRQEHRDVLLREVPHVFAGNTLYATCAVLASAVLVIVAEAGYPAAGTIAATLTGACLRLLAVRLGWRLPRSGPASVSGTGGGGTAS